MAFIAGLSMSPRCLAPMATWIYNSSTLIFKTAGGNVLQVQIVSLPSCVQVSMSITWMLNGWMECVCVYNMQGSNVTVRTVSFFTHYVTMRPDDAYPCISVYLNRY